jgi:general secretion pathway protein D
VLGWLFKNRSKSVAKVNMLFFLTPKIVSAYGKEAARTLKDVLNRRSAHLKETFGEDDPFASTVKGMYNKAKKQEQGPLYDQQEASRYRNENEKQGIDGTLPPVEDEGNQEGLDDDIEFSLDDDEDLSSTTAPPKYNQIVNKVSVKASSTKRR